MRQYLAMRTTGTTAKKGRWDDIYGIERRLLKQTGVLLIVRILYKMEVGGGVVEGVGFALGECRQGGESIDIVDADLFDETLLVIAFRREGDGKSVR